MSNVVYEKITQYILDQLNNGVAPWRKSWAPRGIRAQNFSTGKPYRGVNALMTGMTGESFFMTFKQADELGCQVKKGAKSLPVVYWNFIDDKENDKKSAFIKYYNVFPLSQIELSDGVKKVLDKKIDLYSRNNDNKQIDTCESFVKSTKAYVTYGSDKACYSPFADQVFMPDLSQFDSSENFYTTLFHELTHWSGHDSRLKREGIVGNHAFGDPVYSREELIAELGAAFISAEMGIENTLEQSTAYISGWLKALKNDKKLIIEASGKAQKAADYLLKREPSYEA